MAKSYQVLEHFLKCSLILDIWLCSCCTIVLRFTGKRPSHQQKLLHGLHRLKQHFHPTKLTIFTGHRRMVSSRQNARSKTIKDCMQRISYPGLCTGFFISPVSAFVLGGCFSLSRIALDGRSRFNIRHLWVEIIKLPTKK